MDFKGFTKWYEAVQANKPAMNALMTNLPTEAKGSLQSLYTISKTVAQLESEQAAKFGLQQRRASWLPKWVLGFAADEAGAMVGAHVAGAAGALAGGAMGRVAGYALAGGKPAVPLADLSKFISSAEFKATVKAVNAGDTGKAAMIMSKGSGWQRFLGAVKGGASAIGRFNSRDPSKIEAWLNAGANAGLETRDRK